MLDDGDLEFISLEFRSHLASGRIFNPARGLLYTRTIALIKAELAVKSARSREGWKLSRTSEQSRAKCSNWTKAITAYSGTSLCGI